MSDQVSEIQQLIQTLWNNDVKLESPIYIVERSYDANGDPVMHEPHTTMSSIVTQFQHIGGLRHDRILYMGPDKSKADLIYDTYLKAAVHTRGILGINND